MNSSMKQTSKSNEKIELPECEYANAHLKEIEELESYTKKHIKITNKILTNIQEISKQFGKLANLQREKMNQMHQNEKQDQMLSVNYILSIENIFLDLKNNLSKGYSIQAESLMGEISEVKTILNNNRKKANDSVEKMTTMIYQINNLNKVRNKTLQRHQYLAFDKFKNEIEKTVEINPNLKGAMNQIEDLEEYVRNINLKDLTYVNISLNDILRQEGRKMNQLPRVIEDIIHIIETDHIETEGIFRTAASQKEVNEIYHRLSVTDLSKISCDNLCGVLKRFVRDLPGMLFCNSLARNILEVFTESSQREYVIKNFQNLFFNSKVLPEEKTTLFKSIMLLCHKIASKSEINKMNEKNLAVCWTPSMFSVSQEEISKYLDCVTFIIKEAEWVFDDKNLQYFDSKPVQTNSFTALKRETIKTNQTFNFLDDPSITASTSSCSTPPAPSSTFGFNKNRPMAQKDPTQRYQLQSNANANRYPMQPRIPPSKSLPQNPPPKPSRPTFQTVNHSNNSTTRENNAVLFDNN